MEKNLYTTYNVSTALTRTLPKSNCQGTIWCRAALLPATKHYQISHMSSVRGLNLNL